MAHEIREPAADAVVVDRAVGEMFMALLGARHLSLQRLDADDISDSVSAAVRTTREARGQT